MIWLGLILVLAAGLRIAFNNVIRYSRADETSMLLHARAFLERPGDYRAQCERWLSDRGAWCTPSPVRFGNLLLLGAAFRITGRPTHRTMAWVSALAGVLGVAAAYGIGSELAGQRAGLFAAVLTFCAPLGLAMSRRALQDSAVSATTLGAAWALLGGHPWAGATLLAFLLAEKETAALFFPALAGLCWAAGRPVWWPFPLAGAVYAVAFAALAGGRVGLLWRFARAVSSVGPHPYAVAHQSGPLHRLPLDLFSLGPVAILLAVSGRAVAPALGAAALLLLVLGLVPATKNVRLALPADGLLRISAAGALATMGMLPAIAGVLAVTVSELWIFRRVFLQGDVYDPVTANVLAALGMIPGGTPAPAATVHPRKAA